LTGVVSYLFAAGQEYISGYLIHHGATATKAINLAHQAATTQTTVQHYDFTKPIIFWIGSSILSLILATSLWRVRIRE
jgi:OPA family sugar phosphate sensor protein UhpC-like MFS transporter